MTDAMTGNRVPTSEKLEVIHESAGICAKRTNTIFCGDEGTTAAAREGFTLCKQMFSAALHQRAPKLEHELCRSTLFLIDEDSFRRSDRSVSVETIQALAGRLI